LKCFTSAADIALVGEIDVRRELAAGGWLTINTITGKGQLSKCGFYCSTTRWLSSCQVLHEKVAQRSLFGIARRRRGCVQNGAVALGVEIVKPSKFTPAAAVGNR
jgi:hypothetical protein